MGGEGAYKAMSRVNVRVLNDNLNLNDDEI